MCDTNLITRIPIHDTDVVLLLGGGGDPPHPSGGMGGIKPPKWGDGGDQTPQVLLLLRLVLNNEFFKGVARYLLRTCNNVCTPHGRCPPPMVPPPNTPLDSPSDEKSLIGGETFDPAKHGILRHSLGGCLKSQIIFKS